MHKRNTKHSYSRTKRWRIVITCKCTREYFKHVLYCQKLFRPIPLQWLFWLSTRHLLLTGEIAKCFYYSEMKKENADKFSKINWLLFLWNQDKMWRLFKRFLTLKKAGTFKIWSKKHNNIFVAWIREHSYVTSAHILDISNPPTMSA